MLCQIFPVYYPFFFSFQLPGKMGSVALLFINEGSEAQTGYGKEWLNTLIVHVLCQRNMYCVPTLCQALF